LSSVHFLGPKAKTCLEKDVKKYKALFHGTYIFGCMGILQTQKYSCKHLKAWLEITRYYFNGFVGERSIFKKNFGRIVNDEGESLMLNREKTFGA
jgi:hypothetical protein